MIFEGYAKEQLWEITNKIFEWHKNNDTVAPLDFYEEIEKAANIGYNCACIDHEED